MKQEHFDIVREYIEDNPTLRNVAVADLILEDRVITKSHRTLRMYVGQVRTAEGLVVQTSTVEVDDDDDAIIADSKTKPTSLITGKDDEVDEDGNYNLYYSKEKITISVKEADKIFCAYSRKGLNYSGPSVVSVLGLNKKTFSALVSRLELAKESEPLSAHSMETLSPMEQNERIATISGALLEKFAESDSGIAESIVKEYKKKITDLIINTHREEELYNSLKEYLPKIDVSKYKTTKEASYIPKELYVVIGDMHIGLETDFFNVESSRKVLKTMAKNINLEVKSKGYTDVILLFLGDVMHTVSGVNHANMWKDLEPGLWGAEAMIKPYELIAQFIGNIEYVTEIYGVGGNHDRLADRKDLEPSDEGGKMVFFMLDNTFPDVKVEWDPDKIIFKRNYLTFILLHGDQGQDKKSGQDIAWNLGDSKTYNVILVGHTHSRQISKNDDGKDYRKMVCPAFCPTDSYAERLGYNSLPGYLLINEDGNGYPVVKDIPLHFPNNNK